MTFYLAGGKFPYETLYRLFDNVKWACAAQTLLKKLKFTEQKHTKFPFLSNICLELGTEMCDFHGEVKYKWHKHNNLML